MLYYVWQKDHKMREVVESTAPQASEPPRPMHLERAFRPGKTLAELAGELTRIEESKRDFRVPVKSLEALTIYDSNRVDQNGNAKESLALSFQNGEDHRFTLNSWSGGQVAAQTDIPAQYFRRLSDENPSLLADNVNHGLRKIENKESRLLRTIDNKVRGFLSHRYRIIDSHDILSTALPLLQEHDFQVASCELTEQRMYLKVATPRIQAEVKTGDVVSYGLLLSSSDVGGGAVRVEPYFLRLWCLNGAVSQKKMRVFHAGRSESEREVYEILSDETRDLDNRALLGKIGDFLRHTMNPAIFHAEIAKMQDAAKREIKNLDLDHVVEVTMSTVGVTGKHVKEGILQALADGNQNAGLTQWGLMNSFTAAAKMPSLDYDTATDLERAGGQILNLNKDQWTRIAEKAH